MAGIYIHIPFCERKCLYCGFYSVSRRFACSRLGENFAAQYVKALLRELEQRLHEIAEPVLTLYIGGGTPTLMPADMLKQLSDGIRERIGALWQVEEFTLEANPEQADGEAITAWIFGLPGQSLASWESSLDKLIAIRPAHVSAYALMYDEGTAFTRQLEAGTIKETPDETTEKMYQLLTERLAEEGYEHYEVSNFSLPGLRSRHNSSYWTGVPYIGLGAGAHSYDGTRVRRANPTDLESYVKNFLAEVPNQIYSEEILSDTELREEMIMTRLRTREGLPLALYANMFGAEARSVLEKDAAVWIKRGAVEYSSDRSHLRIAPAGVLLSDAVILSLANF